MPTANFTFYRKQNGCYYRSKPRRWHRAVASRSSYSSPNPNSFSRYIPGERHMDHNERKSVVLPCGRTLAQSWAALRKAWLGFKIARSNGDAALMTHYASFINKVQMEMGIPTTVFESNIINELDFYEIIDRSCFNEKFLENENECTIEQVGPDYDSIMDDARSKMNHNAVEMTPPSQKIFESKNSCFHISPAKEAIKLQPATTTQTNHIKKGCNFIIPEKPSKRRGVGFCYRKYPEDFKQAQSRDKIKGWEQPQTDVVEEDPSYYKYRDDANLQNRRQGKKRAMEYKEKKSKRTAGNTCFYKAER
jgi:hypothetical protein